MERKWDYEIARAGKDRRNWEIWKGEAIRRWAEGKALPYYGILDGAIICAAPALLSRDAVQNAYGLVDDKTVYLSAFRTIEGCQGRGYFSELFRFLLNDLKRRGYTAATLGVEPQEIKNKAIYLHYGFTEQIKTAKETYPDGTEITVEYYRKRL